MNITDTIINTIDFLWLVENALQRQTEYYPSGF